MGKSIFALILISGLFEALFAQAQVTLDELDKTMAAESDTMDAFRARLQDPDPVRARAAMRLLIAKGDAAQRRIAIAHGFESTDPLIRLQAVQAIFNSKPLLLFRWKPENIDKRPSNNYFNAVKNFQGNIEAEYVARVPLQVMGYSDEKECWTRAPRRTCFARINSGELSIRFFDQQGWAQFVLDVNGRLVGNPTISGIQVNAVVDLTK